MSYLTKEDIDLFLEHNPKYVNGQGMQIARYENYGICTSLKHWTHEEGPYEVTISTEYDSEDTFASGFRLQSFRELDQLDYNNSWMRYLNGDAEITVTPYELEIPITFRIHHFKTIISCLNKHFYDEVYKHLTLPEDFKAYIDNNESLLFDIAQRHW